MEKVKVYYNDVFVCTSNDNEPYEVYKDCPSVYLPADTAEKIADKKLENGEWDAYLIPEFAKHHHQIIYL